MVKKYYKIINDIFLWLLKYIQNIIMYILVVNDIFKVINIINFICITKEFLFLRKEKRIKHRIYCVCVNFSIPITQHISVDVTNTSNTQKKCYKT